MKRSDCPLLRWYNGVVVVLWEEQLIILIEANLIRRRRSWQKKGDRDIAGQIGGDAQSGRNDAFAGRESKGLGDKSDRIVQQFVRQHENGGLKGSTTCMTIAGTEAGIFKDLQARREHVPRCP